MKRARRTAPPATSPAAPSWEVDLPDTSLGSGFYLLVAHVGRRWVELTNPVTLDATKLSLADYRAAQRRPAGCKPAAVRRLMRRKAREFKARAWPVPARVKAAIAALGAL